MARDKNDKHAWWKCWEDITTNRNMRRWIRIHGHWIGWAWIGCMKLANDPEKDGRLCNRKSGQAYDAFDVSDEALVSEEQAHEAIALFLAAEWMHRDDDGCLVVSRFYERNVSPEAQRVRRHRDKKQDSAVTSSVTCNAERSVTRTPHSNAQRTEDRGQRTDRTETPQTPQGVARVDFSVQELNLLGTEPVHAVPTAPDPKPQGCKRAQSFYDSLAAYWNEHKAAKQPKAQTPSQPTCKRIDAALSKHALTDADWQLRIRAVCADTWWNGTTGQRTGLTFGKFWEMAGRVRDWTTFEDQVEQYEAANSSGARAARDNFYDPNNDPDFVGVQ